MGLYRLGAHVTCTERPKELAALEASIAQQKKQQGKGVLESALELYGYKPQAATGASPASEPNITSITPTAAESGTSGPAAEAAAAAGTAGGGKDEQPAVQQAGGQPKEQGSITTAALEWGEEGFARSPLSTQQLAPFDFIICSELYYVSSRAQSRAVMCSYLGLAVSAWKRYVIAV
jgi:hypothetical protein